MVTTRQQSENAFKELTAKVNDLVALLSMRPDWSFGDDDQRTDAAQFIIHLKRSPLVLSRNAHIWRMCLLWIVCEISCSVEGERREELY